MTTQEDTKTTPVRHTESSRGLLIALIVVGVMVVAEVVGGILSNSLALLGDAGHMLVDALALSLSLIALRLALRPATETRTFGLHRAEIMAALTNGVILVLVAAFIFYEAFQRFKNPPEVRTTIMLIVAVVGLVANLIAMRLLHHSRHSNLNVRAAFLHVFGDTISSVGVIIGGIIIMFTGWTIVDPIIAIIIGFIILWGAVGLVRESVDILLENVPRLIPMDKVTQAILSVEGVKELHDVHIWTITSGIIALSTHVLVEDQLMSRTGEIINSINNELQKFNITHTTLQLECEKCTTCSQGLVCKMQRTEEVENH